MKRHPKVHDLLGPLAVDSVIGEVAAEQGLIHECLQGAPFVVVRRVAPRGNLIPVGVRGSSREQRYAGWLSTQEISGVTSPESLRLQREEPAFPAFDALLTLQNLWRDMEFPWGPTGSVGFALASGISPVKESSDLDLLFRADQPITVERARQLFRESQGLACRVDIQIETPMGSIALAELAANTNPMLLRCASGVLLTHVPWPTRMQVTA